MKLGIHVSTAGGLPSAIERAEDLSCNTFQIFVSNPRGWTPTIIPDETVNSFKDAYAKAGMVDAVAHSIYLINLASKNPYFLIQSTTSLSHDLLTSSRLGLSGLVTHIGSHTGDSFENGFSRVVDNLKTVLDGYSGESKLLLENTAGAGNLVGDKFSEIGDILKKVDSPLLGFCLDTAHAFESGYDLTTEQGLDNMINEIDQEIGVSKLHAIHLNDSMTTLNSKRDRHEEFGEGEIGKEAMIRIINHPLLKDIPFIMETPKLKTGEAGKEFIQEIRSYQNG